MTVKMRSWSAGLAACHSRKFSSSCPHTCKPAGSHLPCFKRLEVQHAALGSGVRAKHSELGCQA